MRTLQRGFVCFALALGLAGCGGGDGDAASAGSAPVITAQPQSVTIASSGVTTLRVAATGSGALSYQWRRGHQRGHVFQLHHQHGGQLRRGGEQRLRQRDEQHRHRDGS